MDHISFRGQVKVYTGKNFRLFLSEKRWKNLISTLIIVLLISLVTSEDMFVSFKDTKNGSFAIICACIWVGLFNSIQSVCRERAIIKREHRSGLRISAYISAQVIFELAQCGAEALIVAAALLLKNIRHLPPSGLILGAPLDMFLTLFLVIVGADMLALLISCLVKSENAAMTVMPFVLIIQLIMSGAVFELKGVSEGISYATLSKWGMYGITAVANTEPLVRQGSWIMGSEVVDPTVWSLLKSWLILLVFAAVYIFLAILALSQVDRDKR